MSFSSIGKNPSEIISEARHHNHLPTNMISAKKYRRKCCFLSYINFLLKGKEKVIKMIVIIAKEKKTFSKKACRKIYQTNNIIYYISTDAVR